MNLQQTSVNRYIINWFLMVITSFTWLRVFPIPVSLLTGIPVLQSDLYLQLMTSLAFANIIATMSILVHVYTCRNLAFLKTPALILLIEIILNPQLLIVLIAVVSGFVDSSYSWNKIEKRTLVSQYHNVIVLLIAGIAVTNSFILLAKVTTGPWISKVLQWRRKQDHLITMKLATLPPELRNAPGLDRVTTAHEISGGVSKSSQINTLYPADTWGRAEESPTLDKWKFTYNDELIFYFGYCICLPEHYQDYVGPPD
ncbi:hypothetical protein [Mucilaginibacter gynuensis]